MTKENELWINLRYHADSVMQFSSIFQPENITHQQKIFNHLPIICLYHVLTQILEISSLKNRPEQTLDKKILRGLFVKCLKHEEVFLLNSI